jgi:hypothetical protein
LGIEPNNRVCPVLEADKGFVDGVGIRKRFVTEDRNSSFRVVTGKDPAQTMAYSL